MGVTIWSARPWAALDTAVSPPGVSIRITSTPAVLASSKARSNTAICSAVSALASALPSPMSGIIGWGRS